MTEDPKYPIYTIDVRWEQDGEHDEKYPNWHKGLPEGRIWNSSGFNKMYKEYPDLDVVKEYVDEWWSGYRVDKLDGKNSGEPEITIGEPRLETWCLTWFQHYTFDDGRTDKEFLESFERYVRRYAHLQDYTGDTPDNYICLMGAEDRWRWHGETHDDKPPCRCKHCTKQGVVRIGH